MKFFATENLVSVGLAPCVPWEFQPTEMLTTEIRQDKESRQRWYQNTNTKHNFYTGIEPISNARRVAKENPPLYIHAFVADYDLPIPAERIAEVIAVMKHKPTWIETSLSGNRRLVWGLETPILVESTDFCIFVLERAKEWLRLNLLPGLDDPAFTTVTRLYCNGCDWTETKHGLISALDSQAFFVQCGKKFRFQAPEDAGVPLDVVQTALAAKFPNFIWPTDFAKDTQGPSFWIPDSVSPLSAIVKEGGMFTFAAHAQKPFYTWSDILGKEFAAQFHATALAKATTDIWWDSKRYWMKKNEGVYTPLDRPELVLHFKVDCRLSTKPDKTGVSQCDLALNHIFTQQSVHAAAPFVMRPPGLIRFQNKRVLNTYNGKAKDPAAETQVWGPTGNFPFLSMFFDLFLDPANQKDRVLAWFKHFYSAAFYQEPMPGQYCFFMGGVGIGKTLFNRHIVGDSVGGFVDAADFIVNGGTFNSHLLAAPLWCLDDDTPAGSPQAVLRTTSMLKKLVANQQMVNNEKFQVAGMAEWMGRIIITTNLDFVSSRVVGSLDNSSLDKTNLFRCHANPQFKFPDRRELMQILERELPYFLRYLLDWTPPDYVERDVRYGYASYQEASLLDQTHQSGSAAPFKELLVEALAEWFKANPDAACWTGTTTQLMRVLLHNPLNDFVLKSMRLESVNRHMEQVQREGLIKCEVSTGHYKTRIWKFFRAAIDK